VVAGLEALRSDGVALAVVTNKPGDLARTLLTALGIATSFDAIIGDGDGFPRKPDPAAALSILTKVGASPDRAVIVGDGLPDMRLARALGAIAVAATWGYVPAAALAAETPALLAGSFQEAISIIRAAPLD
jgi:phosphoglycolate phosphatase